MKLVSRAALLLLAALFSGPSLLADQEQPLLAGEGGVPVPKKTKHVQPVYPPEAIAQGLRGIVILDLVIDPNGRVTSATVVRSVPGLDEAAIAAAKQWQYEPARMGGKAVSVRLTQAITFSLALPKLVREAGVPELRQGVVPSIPKDAQGRGTATAELTLEADGRVAAARVVEGSEPWAGALLQALQTWRFTPPPDDASLSFRVAAEFDPSRPADARVVLKAGGLQRSDLLAESAPASPVPASPTQAATTPAATTPAAPAPTAPKPPAAAPQAQTPPIASSGTAPATTGTGAGDHPLPPPLAAPSQPGSGPDKAPPPSQPVSPAPVVPPPAGPAPATARGTPPTAGQTAPPPVEVITAPPPQAPPENGVSAIHDVTLQPGVPDLTRGRRPVAPPFARIAGATGTVEVQFSVSAAGTTLVQSVAGPDLLKKAAEGAVASWVFRRTRADRAYLTAVFSYGEDKATAVVRPQPAPGVAAAPAGPVATSSPQAVTGGAVGPNPTGPKPRQ
ncbi:MAG TPA: TonB family protein [Vicinamibacteria bacterium]|nr:TonB family protein [Vicinamibacteria bacterium]